MFSAGRDKNLYLTDLRHADRHTLVCRETAPILKMILTPDQVSVLLANVIKLKLDFEVTLHLIYYL